MQIKIKIDGMSCQHCIMAVKKEISKFPVQNLEVKIGEAIVQFDESLVQSDEIKKAITNAGYIVIQ